MSKTPQPFDPATLNLTARQMAVEIVIASMLKDRPDGLSIMVQALATLRNLEVANTDEPFVEERFQVEAIAEETLRRITFMAGIKAPIS